jgi:uncharacterized membrane protein
MIQIIGLLLCVYLVFKGYEILQIAVCSPRTDRNWSLVVGAIFFLASILIAAFFAFLLLASGAQVSNQMPRLP